MKTIFAFLGTAIFCAWIFFDHLAGVVVFAVAAAVVLITAWAFSDYSFALSIFLFIAMASIAYYMRSRMQVESSAVSVKIEQIQKNSNILMEGMSSHKGVQEALKKKLQRFFQLKELISSLSVQLDVESISKIVTDAAFNIIGKADSYLFYVVDTQKQQLSLSAAKQKNPDIKIKDKTGDVFDRWVLKQRQPLFIEDVRKDYRFDLEKNGGQQNSFKSLISVPMIIEEKITGAIRLNSAKPNSFLPDDLRLLDIISSIAGVSLQNTFLYVRTKELAIRDSLTGVYVQKFFKDRLSDEVTRALRGDYSVSILLLDIDFFKAYNDKYGHAAGDVVLKKVAGILSQAVHDSGDIVARYGGEEFALILMNKDKEEAVSFAEGIRKRIEQQTFVLRRESTKMTVSIGVAACSLDAKICQDLIKAADDALYKAKKSGRNCVSVI